MRRVLSDLLKVIEPMRGVVADVADSCADGNGAGARRWRALTERLERTALSAAALRESFAFILDTSLALSSVATNEVMKRLAGWAAVIAVPTLISSFAGMNVSFPWSGTVAGFWLYTLVMVVAVVAIFLLLRSRGWL
jgi:magnesium transporter